MKTLHDLLGGFSVDQATHDDLVRRTAFALRKAGYTDVCADVSEYVTPQRVYWQRTGDGHVPDVTAGSFIIEVETADSMGSEHTRSQCALFSQFARERRLTFAVVVPAGCKSQMDWQLVLWSITATVWEF